MESSHESNIEKREMSGFSKATTSNNPNFNTSPNQRTERHGGDHCKLNKPSKQLHIASNKSCMVPSAAATPLNLYGVWNITENGPEKERENRTVSNESLNEEKLVGNLQARFKAEKGSVAPSYGSQSVCTVAEAERAFLRSQNASCNSIDEHSEIPLPGEHVGGKYVEQMDSDGYGLLLTFTGNGSNEEDDNTVIDSYTAPRVLVIVTGGTICMDYAMEKCCLKPSKLAHKLSNMPELMDDSFPIFDVLEWNVLVDSSDVGTAEWHLIAKQIHKYYDDYDGFLVLHGTDTMAYTAAALAFILENIGKPVVLTGSMLPLMHVYTDAKRNLASSLMIAGFSQLCEVVVVFGSHVYRGARVTKSDCSKIDAFSSPNFTPIGTVGVDIVLNDTLRRKPPNRRFRIFTQLCPNVAVIKLTPTLHLDVLRSICSTKVRPFAFVLELYGSGTGPSSEPFLTLLKEIIDSGIEICVRTQCYKGSANLMSYQNGVWINSLGIVNGKDLTVEACCAKLSYLLGKGLSSTKLKEFMEMDLRGEVTESLNTVNSTRTTESIDSTELF